MSHEKAFLLLSVAEKALGFPRLKALHDIVLVELEEMADEAAKELAAKAKEKAEAKAKEEAEAKEKSEDEEEGRRRFERRV